MFLKNSSENEFMTSLENNLEQVSNTLENRELARHADTLVYLAAAANLIDEIGLEIEATAITQVLLKLAEKQDPATSGLTSKKMLSNLEHKGWVFNADDGSVSDEEEVKLEADDSEDLTVNE